MMNFDPNGGELGRAKIKHTTPLEFQIIIPYVANILESLHASELTDLPFKYAFEFSASSKDQILLVMENAKLPPYVHFYEVDGHKLFELRGANGGIVSSLICYLITEPK